MCEDLPLAEAPQVPGTAPGQGQGTLCSSVPPSQRQIVEKESAKLKGPKLPLTFSCFTLIFGGTGT